MNKDNNNTQDNKPEKYEKINIDHWMKVLVALLIFAFVFIKFLSFTSSKEVNSKSDIQGKSADIVQRTESKHVSKTLQVGQSEKSSQEVNKEITDNDAKMKQEKSKSVVDYTIKKKLNEVKNKNQYKVINKDINKKKINKYIESKYGMIQTEGSLGLEINTPLVLNWNIGDATPILTIEEWKNSIPKELKGKADYDRQVELIDAAFEVANELQAEGYGISPDFLVALGRINMNNINCLRTNNVYNWCIDGVNQKTYPNMKSAIKDVAFRISKNYLKWNGVFHSEELGNSLLGMSENYCYNKRTITDLNSNSVGQSEQLKDDREDCTIRRINPAWAWSIANEIYKAYATTDRIDELPFR